MLGEEIEVEHCAIPDGYVIPATIFSTSYSPLLGHAIEIFECPLCHDYDFVAHGEALHLHSCGATLILFRPALLAPRDRTGAKATA
jgi:hypothetical protein